MDAKGNRRRLNFAGQISSPVAVTAEHSG